MAELSVEAVEGRLIAHRKLLSLLVACLDHPPTEEQIWDFLEEGSMVQTGEEDPGALPTAAHGIQLALADELRLISERARALRDARGLDGPARASAAG